MLSQFKIAIIGGGPAGLTLGLLLHIRNIPFTIFELSQRYTEQDLEKPSGSLDMHEESGLAAIKECGLLDDFVSLTGDCSEAQKIANKDGTVIYMDEGEASNRPEISRLKLVKVLLSRLPDSTIKWGHKLLSAHTSKTSGHTEVELDFGINGKQSFDLVIGADGAWSKVRNLLTSVKPQYTGIQNITVNIRQVTSKHPQIAEYVGRGTFTSLADRNGVLSQRSTQNSVRVYILISTHDEHFATTTGLKNKTAAQTGQTLLGSNEALFSQWGANIKELMAVACEDESANDPDATVDIKPLYRLPVGHRWGHQVGVTVIGDAAHLMCPWAGEGVNLAMKDSLMLAKAIGEAYELASTTITSAHDIDSIQTILDPLVQKFETDMVDRAKEFAQETIDNGQMMFGSDDGSAAMVEFFASVNPMPE